MNQSVAIAEGKTKRIIPIDAVRVDSKDDITAGDGAKHDVIKGKAALSTTTTCNNFALLRHFGIPVAFYGQDTETSFIAPRCRMLPWEVVVRSKAYGSYLKRNPGTERGQSFPDGDLCTELFLKTSNKRWRNYELLADDPLARILPNGVILLFVPDAPDIHGTHFLTLRPHEVHTEERDAMRLDGMRDIASRAFVILRAAFKIMGVELVDMKVEFGIDPEGRILLADVIDNDSWRLISQGEHLDKQLYRDGKPLEKVLENFQAVARMTSQFHLNHRQISDELHRTQLETYFSA